MAHGGMAKLVVIDDLAKDELSCTLSASGKFCVADYVKKFRSPRPKKDWSDIVWNKYTSFLVNAFSWKVMRAAIPVDINVQRRGHIYELKVCVLQLTKD